MIQGLIFDFDGLILETEGPEYDAWKEIFADYQVELPLSVYGICVGSSADSFDAFHYLEDRIGRPLPEADLRQRQKQRSWEEVLKRDTMPGVVKLLEEARKLNLRTAVASSSSRDWVEGHLGRLALRGYFDAVLCAEDVGGRAKPDPALYVAALRALRLSPDQAIAFEDSQNGVISAKAAGIYCVAVPNDITRSMDFSLAERKVNSLTKLHLEQLITGVGGNGKGFEEDISGRQVK
jgi:HAD superfamily hydrolase (TIGR01509 family)